ncbi:MAG: aminomethyl-transferring glycine dehydrogenase subunit GcvPB [Eubacteriales bacterium]
MKLIFEKSTQGHACSLLPDSDVGSYRLPQQLLRPSAPRLPQLAEIEIARHFTALAEQVHGVNNGFYPLGSCTMKYNPKINEEVASFPGFTKIHPLQPEESAQGCLEAMYQAQQYLCEITGMDAISLQGAAGAHGEFAGWLLIKAYHHSRGDTGRKKIIVPDSAHGTNPASAAMAGFDVVNIPSDDKGCVDLERLREIAGADTAGLMLTNPNTVGIFDSNILKITEIIHDAGGLVYYDGANLNAVAGIVRPGDMGFDVIHLNLHKTFSTPHGGGGPGAGPVGCKDILTPFLPSPVVSEENGRYFFSDSTASIGRMKSFYGHFLVILRALTYIKVLGATGIRQASEHAVLNANYLKSCLEGVYDVAYQGFCMHEFVLTLERTKKETGVSALDIAKALLDYGMHPPTMYFPLIVHEALMFEPTETESKETLDEAAKILIDIYQLARENPQALHEMPQKTPVSRPDEVAAARNPRLRFNFHA